ncbi:DUF5753 domain-containing protein [Streptomyces sp. NPDC059092]|uniref:DUF5753 domain-containing protein n=1 Tax=Streptomyces sp. NPDC059092 TaxID=3346725 RepID=UPI0036C3E629
MSSDIRRRSDIPHSTYVGLEAEAGSILTYENVIPGLFQTRRYAEKINVGTSLTLAESEEVQEQRADVRMQRQQVLTGASPLEVRAVLDESALRRVVGGADLMREQLERLLEVAELPNVILQVIPFTSGAHPGTRLGPFVILRFEHQEDPDVVYAEGPGDPYPADIQQYEVAFDYLRAHCLSIQQTLSLIRNVMDEL